MFEIMVGSKAPFGIIRYNLCHMIFMKDSVLISNIIFPQGTGTLEESVCSIKVLKLTYSK